jgi:hypothetical protein
MRCVDAAWKIYPAYYDRKDGPARFFHLLKEPATEASFDQSAAASDSNILRMPISPARWERLKKTPIESLRWSLGAIRAMEDARCRNLADVFFIKKDDWAGRRQVGRRTSLEIAKRIQSFQKIRRIIITRPVCDTTAIEANIRENKITEALAEAFAMGGLNAAQIRVMEMRYGLSGHPPLLLRECAKITQRTRQCMFLKEKAGKRRLSNHPDILRAFQSGLKFIQGRLWRKLAGKNRTFIANGIATRQLYKTAGGPDSLLIKVSHGDIKKWLNKNLAKTSQGWRIPELNGD